MPGISWFAGISRCVQKWPPLGRLRFLVHYSAGFSYDSECGRTRSNPKNSNQISVPEGTRSCLRDPHRASAGRSPHLGQTLFNIDCPNYWRCLGHRQSQLSGVCHRRRERAHLRPPRCAGRGARQGDYFGRWKRELMSPERMTSSHSSKKPWAPSADCTSRSTMLAPRERRPAFAEKSAFATLRP